MHKLYGVSKFTLYNQWSPTLHPNTNNKTERHKMNPKDCDLGSEIVGVLGLAVSLSLGPNPSLPLILGFMLRHEVILESMGASPCGTSCLVESLYICVLSPNVDDRFNVHAHFNFKTT